MFGYLRPFGIMYGRLVYAVFGPLPSIFFPFWYVWTTKNLASLTTTLFKCLLVFSGRLVLVDTSVKSFEVVGKLGSKVNLEDRKC
jgi:hypothetical protein